MVQHVLPTQNLVNAKDLPGLSEIMWKGRFYSYIVCLKSLLFGGFVLATRGLYEKGPLKQILYLLKAALEAHKALLTKISKRTVYVNCIRVFVRK